MAKKICDLCSGTEGMGWLSRISFTDKTICKNCFKKIFPYNISELSEYYFNIPELKDPQYSTYDQYKEKCESLSERYAAVSGIGSTYDAYPIAEFNDEKKLMILYRSCDRSYPGSSVIRKWYAKIVPYDSIFDYELLEDGGTVASLDAAAKGAFWLGTTGAVVASNTAKKSICTNLQLKVYVRGMESPAYYCDIITEQTDKDSSTYKDLYKCVQDAIAKLKQIITDRGSTEKQLQTFSMADEIRKFKSLLDEGIITEEEFNTKKKELLGI